MPPPARELRFRITESSDPRSFARGQDLLWRWGLPWSIPLLAICGSRAFGIIKDTLLTSRQLTNELVESCKGMLRMNWPGKVGARSRIIYSLGQSFYAELHRCNERLWFLAHDLQDLKLDDIFADWRDPKHWPYAGSALWCFERSRLPEHRKKRIIVLRCLQVIEPIRRVTPDYDGYVTEPTPGALFTVGGQPYAINMDPPSAMAKVVKRLLIQRQIANAIVSKVKAQNQKNITRPQHLTER
ncbi:hypothetical protein A0H81_08069 [Grifola frondosa]|uniref:Uncharacterized protein n=1 Tax=Grifola frondosa TaxID=5627 RepID=A0A1C7M6C7_GRIFR|nr:hypothetical protein A0H81_08069 [Grifola frondosa]